MTIARHLIALLKEYDLKTIANGLRWVINGWKLEVSKSCALCLQFCLNFFAYIHTL